MTLLTPRVKIGIKRTAGVLLIIIGIAGLILPIVPGIPILFVGLELLGLGLVVRAAVEKALRRAGMKDDRLKTIDKPPSDPV